MGTSLEDQLYSVIRLDDINKYVMKTRLSKAAADRMVDELDKKVGEKSEHPHKQTYLAVIYEPIHDNPPIPYR